MNNLTKYRVQKGLTQEQLGKEVGVTRAAICFCEKNSFSLPVARKCAEVLEVNLFELLGTDVLKIIPTTEADKKALIKIIEEL